MAGVSHSKHYEHLKNLWTNEHREIQKEIAQKHEGALRWLTHHVRNAAVSGMALTIGLNHPVVATASNTLAHIPYNQPQEFVSSDDLSGNAFLLHQLQGKVPHDVRPLTQEEENEISKILSHQFGLKISAEFDGKRLNRSYGYIGQEQHLTRYPGDTIATHFSTPEEAQKYAKYGMAPGRGAWGYFASGSQVTEKDIEREKYYIAVQTFLAPGFMENVREHYDFYKYRKMLVVNPENGRAMVVVIGDAGPAEWTGKSLGGSPEVMDYLKRVDGKQKGPVLYFFIDDPEDKIPLGPVNTV